MIDRLTWLHISDFHFTNRDDRFSQTIACQKLLQDIDSRRDEHGPIAFVLVTGDIAFSGQPGEYSRASTFMHELSACLSVPTSQFFFVPGNHDVNRNDHDFAHLGALQVLSSQVEVDRALGDRTRIADLLERQAAYRDFLTTFCADQERTETPDGLGYVAQIHVEPLRIAIIGLNSSWLCGSDEDHGSLVIGERQIIGAMSLVHDISPQLTIALSHHPIEWLAEWDQKSCRASLLPNAHFLLRGHLHESDVSMFPHRKCVIIAAGSAHAGRFYPNSYNIVSLDLGAGLAVIHPYTYRQEEGAFTPEAPIPTTCQLEGEIPGTAQDLAEAITTVIPSLSGLAAYMAAILLGQKDEIPLRIDGTIEFVPSVVAFTSDPHQTVSAKAFFGLKNLLRLHQSDMTLSNRVKEHSTVIQNFASWLNDCTESNEACRMRIVTSPLVNTREETSSATRMPYTVALIAELRSSEQWDALEVQARRSIESTDRQLARQAKEALVEALIHSDEGQKRIEATELADELVADQQATTFHYLLACAASEIQGEVDHSIHLLKEALSRWPQSDDLISYGRDLATRTGSASVRSALDAARGGFVNHE